MKTFALFVSYVSFLSTLATAVAIPGYFQKSPFTRRGLSVNEVQQELGPQLSNGTLFYAPDDPQYANATGRWNAYALPLIQVIVVPAQESDVPTIVKYCNQNSVEFLANNRGHGWPQSLGSFNGIQIDLENFRTIDIQPGGQSAWFGGGSYAAQVTAYLWDQGYVATTAACDCVGMMGPGLGGGFGRHGGVYGLISDNILQLNVVLASGEMIVVNSTSYSDLFWGMRGAGHNFGIVTSFELKIYPRGPDTWHYHNYIWRGEKLETIFEAINTFQGNNSTPVNMTMNYGSFAMNTTITTEEPVIHWTFAYRGSAEEAEALLAPFNAIESVYEDQGDLPYPNISVAQQMDLSSIVCQHGNTMATTTVFLKTYNVTAERKIFDSFNQTHASNPALTSGASILQEGYSTEAVQAIPSDDSAFPWRDDVHLAVIHVVVGPNNATLLQQAWQWAEEIRDLWIEGEPGQLTDAYVNYANGYEPTPEVYGHEQWRLDRLTGLKTTYDPQNRFQYYNPIIVTTNQTIPDK